MLHKCQSLIITYRNIAQMSVFENYIPKYYTNVCLWVLHNEMLPECQSLSITYWNVTQMSFFEYYIMKWCTNGSVLKLHTEKLQSLYVVHTEMLHTMSGQSSNLPTFFDVLKNWFTDRSLTGYRNKKHKQYCYLFSS